MDSYSGFEDLTITLNTTLGVLTGTFIGFDSTTDSHIMNINGQVTAVPVQSILGLISTSSFQWIDESKNTHVDVNIEPGGTAAVHFRKARVASNIQRNEYENWEALSLALKASIQQTDL